MDIPSKSSDLLEHMIKKTCEQVEAHRGVPVLFHLKKDGLYYVAKFDFGRESRDGSIVQAICGAVGNALEPIEHQSFGNLRG